jgi:hypothetical protein
MGVSNRSILAKADLKINDLLTDGGILPEAAAKRFLQVAVKNAVILPVATVVPMKSREQRIDLFRFQNRILRPGQEATALPEADRSKPNLYKATLSVKLFKGEIRLNKEVLEDNIESDNFQDSIMDAAGKAVARDIDELVSNGDTASADPFLAQLDGIRKQATSNIVNAAGAGTTKTILKASVKAMPTEHLRDRRAMRFLTSFDSETDYRDSLADRATAVGDRFLLEGVPATYSGIPMLGVPVFPENLGPTTNYTEMLLLDPKNINVGFWRQIEWETDKDIVAGELIIVVSLRMDVKFAFEPAVVKVQNLKVG